MQINDDNLEEKLEPIATHGMYASVYLFLKYTTNPSCCSALVF